MPFKKIAVRQAIILEFKNTRFLMANAVFLITDKLGELDQDTIQWVIGIIKETPTEDLKKSFKETISKLSEKDKKALAQVGAMKKAEIKSGKASIGLGLKKYLLTVTDLNTNNYSLFDKDFQYMIIEIKSIANNLDQMIDQYRFYYEKTFDSNISKGNYQICYNNMIQNYSEIKDTMRLIIKKMTKFIKDHETGGFDEVFIIWFKNIWANKITSKIRKVTKKEKQG